MNLDVSRKGITESLALLNSGEWQVPKFQREFVWNQSQVYELLISIFHARPIGMITTWVQPQGNPQTPPEPLLYKGQKFGKFGADPAVIKLVLDGKQRLTTLAIAFGGLRPPNERYLFSGSWFLNFAVDPSNTDDLIKYKKRTQVASEGLDQIPNCLAKGLMPLDRYNEFVRISQRIFDKDFYPAGQLPEQAELEKRSKLLADHIATFNGFQIPVAELPSTVTLGEVCEIFEVLNTTGTKVSTFDLIHNMAFGDTVGKFNLRDIFDEIAQNPQKLQLLCDTGRPEYICQLVTGCYLSEPKPVGRQSKTGKEMKITSIKGGDLIETPTSFYQTFFSELPLVQSFATEFFSDLLGGDFRLKDLPYPASTVLYFSLRWKREKHLTDPATRYSAEELHRLFKAFFWRNALTNRYDQGFLTLFATDLQALNALLQSLVPDRGNNTAWIANANAGLEKIFTATHSAKPEADLKAILLEPELRGALRQAVILFLNSRVTTDLVTGKALNRFTTERTSVVDLHHIYPRQWCKDNAGSHQILQEKAGIEDGMANLVPLSADSNNKWKSRSPATAISEFQIAWASHGKLFEAASIDQASFNNLADASPNPAGFWESRAAALAKQLHALQFVS